MTVADTDTLSRGLPIPRADNTGEERFALAVLRSTRMLFGCCIRSCRPCRNCCVSRDASSAFEGNAKQCISRSFPLSIHKRVEYLSLAVGNAKSQSPATRGDAVQFLTDIEEKLEVAQVQIEIYRGIEELDLSADEKRQWLDKIEDRLYTISEVRPLSTGRRKHRCKADWICPNAAVLRICRAARNARDHSSHLSRVGSSRSVYGDCDLGSHSSAR